MEVSTVPREHEWYFAATIPLPCEGEEPLGRDALRVDSRFDGAHVSMRCPSDDQSGDPRLRLDGAGYRSKSDADTDLDCWALAVKIAVVEAAVGKRIGTDLRLKTVRAVSSRPKPSLDSLRVVHARALPVLLRVSVPAIRVEARPADRSMSFQTSLRDAYRDASDLSKPQRTAYELAFTALFIDVASARLLLLDAAFAAARSKSDFSASRGTRNKVAHPSNGRLPKEEEVDQQARQTVGEVVAMLRTQRGRT